MAYITIIYKSKKFTKGKSSPETELKTLGKQAVSFYNNNRGYRSGNVVLVMGERGITL
jgi:hypothetical protein